MYLFSFVFCQRQMRSLQSIVKDRIANPSTSGAVDKKCWLCHGESPPRFVICRRTIPFCYSCFRTIYLEVIRPIRLAERVSRSHTLAQKIEAAQEHCSSTELQSTAVYNSGPWKCPSCARYNEGQVSICSTCGFIAVKKCVCKKCLVVCYFSVSIAQRNANQSFCKDGRPHEVWCCDKCNRLNTLDADYCECGEFREWICSTCTKRHKSPRGQDSLRFCDMCQAYNTPDDIFRGHVTLAQESLVGGKRSASAAWFGETDQATLREIERQNYIEENELRLRVRLEILGISRHKCKDDGNCLFSAVAHQLFGKESLSRVVRRMVVGYMATNPDAYAVFFESPAEFAEYLANMKCDGTWGDELCLNAVARCFRVDVHVISSSEGTWHLVFRCNSLAFSKVNRSVKAATPPSIFLIYQCPVHYDDVEMNDESINVSKAVSNGLKNFGVTDSNFT